MLGTVLGCRPIDFKFLTQLRILQHRDIRRHLHGATAHQLSERHAQFIVMGVAPVDCTIHQSTVDVHITAGKVLAIMHLALDHGVNHAFHRSDMTECILHCGDLNRA